MKTEAQILNHKKTRILIIGLLIGFLSVWSVASQYHNDTQASASPTTYARVMEDKAVSPITSAKNIDEDQHYNFLTSFIQLEAKCHKKEPTEETSSTSAYVQISDLFKVLW